MNHLNKCSVYVDTSILGNWFLYYRNRNALKKAEKRFVESFDLMTEIEKDNLRCSFVSSTWATSELADVVIDEMVSKRMMEDGIPLSQFPSRRRMFAIENEEDKTIISDNIADFRKFLKKLNVRIRSFEIDDDSVNDLLLKHVFLPTPDALHLSFAVRSCDLFLTLDDRHFLESKHRKEIEDEDGIRILRPYELIKEFRKLSRSGTLDIKVEYRSNASESGV
jgi:predicted nucleic acid-binding protein